MEQAVVGPYSARRRDWVLAGVLAGVTALHAVVALVVRPSMFSDSGWGFLVLESMKDGAPFNNLVSPNPLDIATDSAQFLSWWSPGQYLVPRLFELLGADLGVAMVLTSAVFSALGALGWCQCYRSFGFHFKTIAISVLAIVTTRWFALPFGIYNGGEVLLFGVAPWVALLFWRLRQLPAVSVPILTGAMLLLTGAKLTGAILGGALLSACLLVGGPVGSPRRWLMATGTSTLFAAIFFVEWLAKGSAPGMGSAGSWAISPLGVVFPLFAAVSSSLGIGDLLSWILIHPSRPVLTSLSPVIFALVPLTGLLLWFAWRHLRTSSMEYVRFAIAVSALFSSAFVLVSARGGASFEERHFRSIGLLLLVGFVQVFAYHRSKLVRMAFYSLLFTMALYGLGSAISHAKHNFGSPMGMEGFRHNVASAPVLDFMKQRFENRGKNEQESIVYVPSPEIGLEVRGARVIAAQADFESVSLLGSREYRGTVRTIHIFVQKSLVENGKARVILESFKDYDPNAWRQSDLGDFLCYEQREPSLGSTHEPIIPQAIK